MKKLKIFFITLFILITYNFVSNIYAASTDKLMTLGDSSHNITITKGTTVADIINVLGQPKIQTVSVFGGQAYTFYTDDDYNNYLYIETAKNGKIASYGSVDPTYKIYDSKTQGYGDDYNYSNTYTLHGYLFSNSGTVEGGVYYNTDALYEGDSSANTKTIEFFTNTYKSNPTKYLRGISEHAVTMYNALSTRLGNKTNLEFNEDFFYINEQFKKLGTSTRRYIIDMNKDTVYMKPILTVGNIELTTDRSYLLCPMCWANFVKYNRGEQFGDKNQAVFDYDIENKELYALGLKANVYDKVESVQLTPEEQSKLSAGRYEFNQAKINFAKDSGIFEIEPVATSASALVAGKLKASKEQAILDYVNAIRAAAGIPKLTLDRDCYTTAQYISTLMTYRWNVLGKDIEHKPEKPTGVSDEYYNIAIGNEKGYTENLGRTANSITVDSMKASINTLIEDRYENPQLFSHRQKILHASYTKFGYGISPNMYSNEFYGTRDTDVFLEAWPSNGITFLETYNKDTKWSAQFTSKYKVTDTTTASIKCLNTNEVYDFDTKVNTDSKVFLRYKEEDNISALHNKIIMYDSKIVPQVGYVYEITLNNLKDEATGSLTKYTYRTVFEYGDTDNYPSKLSSIKIVPPANLKKVTGKDVYYVPLDNEVEFNVNIDSNVVDKKITWVSSNSDAVEVRQNGTVIAKKLIDEDVTITVCYDGTNITDQVVVRPYRKIDDVRLDKTSINLLAKESTATDIDLSTKTSLTITYIPTDNTEIVNIDWKIIRDNDNTEYSIDDPYITQYIKVTKTDKPEVINIEAIDVESGNNKYTVMAVVEGISGTYNGACDVTIRLPITNLSIEVIAESGKSGIQNLIGSKKITIDYNQYNYRYFNLSAIASPSNTTDSRDVTWSVEDSNIISDYDQNGRFRIEKEGSTNITATSKERDNVKIDYSVTVNSRLESLSLSGVSSQYMSEGKNLTNQLTLTRVPEIDNDTIEYTVDNDELATVDSTGLVSFKGPGTVKVTANSKELPSVKTVFTYNVYMYVTRVEFPGISGVQQLTVGEAYQEYKAKCVPANTSYANSIVYSSNNPDVAYVNKTTGAVIAMSPGQAIITATVSGNYTADKKQKTAQYSVNVGAPLKNVVLPATKKMVINSTYTFEPVLVPDNTTDIYTIRYESDDPNKVEIDPTTGIAKAKQLGKANIKVIVTDITQGGTEYTDTTEVEVINYLPGDVDLSGKVDAVDASLVLTLFKNHNATDLNLAIGDVDSSTILDAVDAMQILSMYKNNVYGE